MQHGHVAIAVAKGADRTLPHKEVNGGRFRLAVIEIGAVHGLADLAALPGQGKLAEGKGANHLLGRDAIHLLGHHPHKIDAAAGDNPGLEAIIPQIPQQLLHRQITELIVVAAKTGILAAVDPASDPLGKLGGGHAAVGQSHQLGEPLLPRFGHGLEVVVQHCRDDGVGLPLRVFRCQTLDLVHRKLQLIGHGRFRPEGAVIVKHHMALLWRNKSRLPLIGGIGHPAGNRLLGRRVIPGREGIALASLYRKDAAQQQKRGESIQCHHVTCQLDIACLLPVDESARPSQHRRTWVQHTRVSQGKSYGCQLVLELKRAQKRSSVHPVLQGRSLRCAHAAGNTIPSHSALLLLIWQT